MTRSNPVTVTETPRGVPVSGGFGDATSKKATRRAAKQAAEHQEAAHQLGIPVDDVALSYTDLAKAAGISRPATTKHVKRLGWPFSKTPPWSKAAYVEWYRMNVAPDNAEFWRKDQAAEKADGPDEPPMGDGDQFAQIVDQLVDWCEEDPRFWLRAVLGIVFEIAEGGPHVPVPKDLAIMTPAARAEFYLDRIRKIRAHRAQLKKLTLATDEEVNGMLETNPITPVWPQWLVESSGKRAWEWQSAAFGMNPDVVEAIVDRELAIPGQHNPVPLPFEITRE